MKGDRSTVATADPPFSPSLPRVRRCPSGARASFLRAAAPAAMTQTPTDISPLSLLLRRVDAAVDGAPAPDTIATGFPSLDKLLGGGVRRGDLVVLAGDVGAGKSALALAIGLRAAAGGSRAAFYSGEMTAERVLERALA